MFKIDVAGAINASGALGQIGTAMKTAAFSIDRTDERDIRDAARHAARRDGLSLVDWLDRVMSKSADALGLGLNELGPNERIEAVRQRLGWAEDEARRRAPTLPARSERAEAPTIETPAIQAATAAGHPLTPEAPAERQSSHRAEIESKLNALFKALDRQSRRTDHAAALAEAGETIDPPAGHRTQALMGETAIVPARHLEDAIAAIADRQMFLDRKMAAEPAPLPRHAPSLRFGSPRDAAEDLRRQFGTPEPEAEPAEPVADMAPPPAPAPAEPVQTVFTELQGDVGRLAKRLEAGPVAAARAAPETTFADIRALLDEMRPDASIDSLGRHVEALAQRLDKVIDRPAPTEAINTLSQRIEEVHAELTAALTAEAKPPAIDLATIERMVHEVVSRTAATDRTMPLLEGLEHAMQGLAVKLDHVQNAQVDAGALAELQAQVTSLASRIDRTDAGLSTIAAMERSLGEVFTQVSGVRDVAEAAGREAARGIAEAAGREAAREAVREAAIEGDGLLRGPSDPAVEQVSRDLADFRQVREDADKRLHVILGTLNSSLERVVDRLGTLEEESASGRPASPRPEPRVPVIEEPKVAPVAAVEHVLTAPALSALSPDGLATPIDLDMPIEPGVGRPRRAVEAPDEAAVAAAPDPASFIAAARRAAQSATMEHALRAEAAATQRGLRASDRSVAGLKGETGKSRRPLLLALAGLVLLLGAAQVVRISLNSGEPADVAPAQAALPAPPAETAAVAASDSAATAPADAVQTAEAVPAAPASAPVPAAAAASAPVPAAAAAKPDSLTPNRPLPTMAMGPAAAVAAAQVSENAARAAASGGIGAGLRELAQDGHPDAQYEMGLRLADGRGVARDMVAAAAWLEKSAKQGLAPAAYRLGSLYEKGLGVTRDPAQSISWYRKAADAGNVRAMHNLAVMLAEGAGGKADYPAAATWFTRAAEAGVRDSQFNLAILCARGLGVDQSLSKSYMWFALAAGQGDTDAAKKRDEVALRLDAAALADAKKAVDTFKPAVPNPVANDVPAPVGGWDAVLPTHPASGKAGARVNMM